MRVPADATHEDVSALLRKLVPLLNLHAVGKCFSTVRIEPLAVASASTAAENKGKVSRGEQKSESKGGGGGGEVKLVMNEWMSQAWPHD